RWHVARLIMDRSTIHYDQRGTFSLAARVGAEAETFVHMATIARGYSRREALGWLGRAIRANPRHPPAWREVAAAVTPNALRRFLRRLRGASGAWERACHTPVHRPQAGGLEPSEPTAPTANR